MRMPLPLRACLLLVLALFVPLAAQTSAPAGQWEGSIAIPGAPLQVVVRLYRGADNAFTGSMDIPAQGMKGGGLRAITVNGRSVQFSIANVPGNPTFTGTVSDDDRTIAGEFVQGGGTLTFSLKRTGDAPPPPAPARRPQTPRPPFPYTSTDVTVNNTAGGVRLAGTLTTPPGSGPFTAVVLISGSGAQDRDETIAGHKPFFVLADHLTRRGIAVLRLDDRGIGGSTGGPATATSEDFAGDTLAAIEFLRTQPRINPARVGLIGHSEGGMIAPMVAVRSRAVAFQVLMAGSGITGEEILYLQAALIARAGGATEAQVATGRALQERLYTVLKTEKDLATMQAKIRDINGEAAARTLTLPWFRFFVTHDPAIVLGQITIPTLAINGERDLQVPFKENLGAIEAALRAAGNKEFTIRSFPGLNHLFQTSQTGLPAEYQQIEETIAPAVLEAVTDWIGRR